jgi:hypothetical protein
MLFDRAKNTLKELDTLCFLIMVTSDPSSSGQSDAQKEGAKLVCEAQWMLCGGLIATEPHGIGIHLLLTTPPFQHHPTTHIALDSLAHFLIN